MKSTFNWNESAMKKVLLCTTLLSVAYLGMSSTYAATPTTAEAITQSASQTERNKAIVIDFFEGVFQKHDVKAYSDRYLDNDYIQHNPFVPNGKAAFINYFVPYFKENPSAKSSIKRVIADGDLVWLHVHAQENAKDLGSAVVDIFRLKDGKIVEHWDVVQKIPAKSANSNTMF